MARRSWHLVALMLSLSHVATQALVCEDGFHEVNGECLYACTSDLDLGTVTKINDKGIALDDTTFQYCSDRIPRYWPNTKEPVKRLRIFKSWDVAWDASRREGAWEDIRKFVHANKAKVLIGTQVTCSEKNDTIDWQWSLGLMRLLGPDYIQGLAIGNEMELYQFKGSQYGVTPECIENIWGGGYYFDQVQKRVAEMDQYPGFDKIPVTSVFGGMALAAYPFYNYPCCALVFDYLKNVTAKYGKRYVFTWNFYPYFDQTLQLDPNTSHSCCESLDYCLSYGPDGISAETIVKARSRMQLVTNRTDDVMWLGEMGWSSATSDTLHSAMRNCTEFSTPDTMHSVYNGFLKWDMSVQGVKAPELSFYFTMRDSANFGVKEHFGLIDSCEASHCKLSTTHGGEEWVCGKDDFLSETTTAAEWAPRQGDMVSVVALSVVLLSLTLVAVRFGLRRVRDEGGDAEGYAPLG